MAFSTTTIPWCLSRVPGNSRIRYCPSWIGCGWTRRSSLRPIEFASVRSRIACAWNPGVRARDSRTNPSTTSFPVQLLRLSMARIAPARPKRRATSCNDCRNSGHGTYPWSSMTTAPRLSAAGSPTMRRFARPEMFRAWCLQTVTGLTPRKRSGQSTWPACSGVRKGTARPW